MEIKNSVSRIREIAREVAESGSLEFVHVEIANAGNRKIVRVFIDKVGGVTHDDCAFVSSGIDKFFEQEDPISGEYFLEVSSPGIERGLYCIEDFSRFSGSQAKLKTFELVDGQRNFSGKILGVKDGIIEFDDATCGSVEFVFEQIKKANLEFDIERELKTAGRDKGGKRAR